MSAALRSVGFLDVLSSTPAESSRRAPCIHARLRRLAKNLHEYCGLETSGMNGNYRWQIPGIIGLSIVCFVCQAMSLEPQHPGDPQNIQVESALVTVPVVVRDAQGQYLNGLPPASFKLFEDGRQVPVSLFLTSEDPVKIALLIDTSRSATTVLKKIKKAAGQFLKQMRPQDLAMVAGFDSEVQVLCPFSSDARELKESINRAKSGGTYTRMHDASRNLFRIDSGPSPAGRRLSC